MSAGDLTQGRRREDTVFPWAADFDAGDYCLRDGIVWVRLPNGAGPSRLEGWTHVEHDDDTITLSPSILEKLPDGSDGWHGYLERGVWRQV